MFEHVPNDIGDHVQIDLFVFSESSGRFIFPVHILDLHILVKGKRPDIIMLRATRLWIFVRLVYLTLN